MGEVTGPDRAALMAEAIRRGLIDSSEIEAEAVRRGLIPPPDAPVSPEVQAQRGQSGQFKPEAPGMIDGLGQAAADAAFMGYGDNVAAFAGAVAGANPESGRFFDYGATGGFVGGFPDRYQANLDMERERRSAFRESNPNATTAAEIAGGVLGAATLGRAAPVRTATTTGGQVAQAAGGGALFGGLTAAGMADDPDDSRLLQGAQGGAIGLVLGPVAIPVMALTRRLGDKLTGAVTRLFKRSPQSFDPATGALTEEGRRQLMAIGVNADEVSSQLARAYQEAAQEAIAGGSAGAPVAQFGEATARTAPARSFGIDTTRGQATGSVPQIAAEEAMRAGARGDAAFQVMDEFGRRQRGQVQAAREGLGREVAPGGGETDAIDAAEMAIEGVRRESEAARQAGRAAYKEFEALGGGVRGDSIAQLRNNIGFALDRELIIDSPELVNTNRARQYMDLAFKDAEKGAVPFTRLEGVRQQLRRYASAANAPGANPDDARALRAMIDEYDDFLQSSVDNALMTEGDGAAMEAVRKARGLWGEYLRTYTGKKGADNMIRKIVEDEMAPDQVVSWLFGASKNIGGGQASLIAKRFRDILGADSPEFQALKKAAFDRITMRGDDVRGPDDIVSALGEFLDGKGKTLSREMFNPQELRRIREFREAMRVLQVPQKAANRSGSGYEVARAGAALVRGLAATLGMATGGPAGAIVGAAGSTATANFANRMAAKAATQGITGPAPSLGGAVGLGGGGAAALAEESPIR